MNTILDLAPGLHPNVAPELYHARHSGLVSKSALDLVNRSPAHLKAWTEGKDEEPSDALMFGSAFHCALLEPDRFSKTYTTEPDFGDCRKKDNKATRDEWRAAHAGMTPISAEDASAISDMVKAVHAHPLGSRMVRDGEPELTVRWQDEATGLQCKTRADYYVRAKRMIVDVKSSVDASYGAFRRAVENYRYHVQDALYRSSFAAVDAPFEHFVFVVVEKTAPYAIATYTLDSDGVARGYSHARRNIDTIADCLRTGVWPGYPVGIQTLTLPAWAA